LGGDIIGENTGQIGQLVLEDYDCQDCEKYFMGKLKMCNVCVRWGKPHRGSIDMEAEDI